MHEQHYLQVSSASQYGDAVTVDDGAMLSGINLNS